MAEGPRMTAAQVADKLLASEHADVLRQSVAWIVAELMEAEVAAKVGAEFGQRTLIGWLSVTAIGPDRGTPGWVSWSCASQAAPGQLLPELLGAAPAGRAGAGRGGPGGLRQRGVDPAGGPAGGAAGHRRHVQGPGIAVVPRAGRAGAGVRGAAAGGPLPVPVVGRQGGTGPRARRGPAQGAGGGLRRGCLRPVGGARPGCGCGRDRGVLAGVPAVAGASRSGRGAAGGLRRPPGPQAGDRPGVGLPVAAVICAEFPAAGASRPPLHCRERTLAA
jgi:hypothetical protein